MPRGKTSTRPNEKRGKRAFLCAHCWRPVAHEHFTWRLCENIDSLPGEVQVYWRGRHWFLYCSDCKHCEPGLRGTYINADGHNSTDSESPSPSPRAAAGPRPSGWSSSKWSSSEWTSSEWNSSQWIPREWQCRGTPEARDPDPNPAAVPGALAQALVAAFEDDDWGLSGGAPTTPKRPGRIPVTSASTTWRPSIGAPRQRKEEDEDEENEEEAAGAGSQKASRCPEIPTTAQPRWCCRCESPIGEVEGDGAIDSDGGIVFHCEHCDRPAHFHGNGMTYCWRRRCSRTGLL